VSLTWRVRGSDRAQRHASVRRAALSSVAGLTTAVLLLAGCSSPISKNGSAGTGSSVTAGSGAGPVIAAAGDIACEPGRAPTPSTCQQAATSHLLDGVRLAGVLTLGDEQYVEGRIKGFRTVYAPTWGRYLPITHPAPGNHEYKSSDQLKGYYDYFGRQAGGEPTHPYYSFDIGSWHIVALDAACGLIGGCGFGSPEERWLAADLAAHPATCTLAYWHEPRFSSGGHGDNTFVSAFWEDLYAAHADVVLNGHDHDYERFGPQTPQGVADPAHGIREFVVGTGGKSLRPLHRPKPNSEARADSFGVLFLTLGAGSYSWHFRAIPGESFSDSGSGACH
jgi:acid phosphatase type 7